MATPQPSVHHTDPGWLLTSVLATSAATIAILGGLLVALQVSKETQRAGAAARKQLADEYLVSAQNAEERLRNAFNRIAIDIYIAHVTPTLAAQGGTSSMAKLGKTWPFVGDEDRLRRELDPLKDRIADLTNSYRAAADAYREARGPGSSIPEQFEEAKRRLNLEGDPHEEHICAWVWYYTWQRKAGDDSQADILQASGRDSEAIRQWRANRTGAPPTLTEAGIRERWQAKIKACPKPVSAPTNEQRRDRLEDDLAAAADLVKLRATERALAEAAVTFANRPPGLKWPVLVLLFLAGVGVVWPLLLLAHQPYTVSAPVRYGMAVGYMAGAAAMLGLLIVRFLPPEQRSVVGIVTRIFQRK